MVRQSVTPQAHHLEVRDIYLQPNFDHRSKQIDHHSSGGNEELLFGHCPHDKKPTAAEGSPRAATGKGRNASPNA